MRNFFFDTANVDFIKKTWKKLSPTVNNKLVVGITTNPNAFYKINKLELKEWLNHLPVLCELVSEIRQDSDGVVYVQGPSSTMDAYQTLKYAELVSNLTDGNTKIGLKIPPYKHILEITNELSNILDVNVTGLADCSTALKSASYNVRYISIIPGRMEEVGIDAKSHIAFLNQSNLGNTEIIAGSMRTFEQLVWTFQYGTVPTIGERVWPTLFENGNLELLQSLNYSDNIIQSEFSPIIIQDNINLSYAFFEQMDKCGETAFSNLEL